MEGKSIRFYSVVLKNTNGLTCIGMSAVSSLKINKQIIIIMV